MTTLGNELCYYLSYCDAGCLGVSLICSSVESVLRFPFESLSILLWHFEPAFKLYTEISIRSQDISLVTLSWMPLCWMFIVLNTVMLNVFGLNVDSSECRYPKCHWAECHCAECHAECHAECRCVPSVQTSRTAHAQEKCLASVTTWKRKVHKKKLKRQWKQTEVRLVWLDQRSQSTKDDCCLQRRLKLRRREIHIARRN
jgi:hypothetical protein